MFRMPFAFARLFPAAMPWLRFGGVHLCYSTDPRRPWMGCSLLKEARTRLRELAGLESRLGRGGRLDLADPEHECQQGQSGPLDPTGQSVVGSGCRVRQLTGRGPAREPAIDQLSIYPAGCQSASTLGAIASASHDSCIDGLRYPGRVCRGRRRHRQTESLTAIRFGDYIPVYPETF